MSIDRKLVALSVLILGASALSDNSRAAQEIGDTSAVTKTAEGIPDNETVFEQVTCNKTGVTLLKPFGWSLFEKQITPNFSMCFLTEKAISDEIQFVSGLSISKLVVPLVVDKIGYARGLATQPELGALPKGNTFQEFRQGSSRIFIGEFNNTRNNKLSDEVRRIIVPDGYNTIYRVSFIAPKPSSQEDFRKFGSRMLESITPVLPPVY